MWYRALVKSEKFNHPAPVTWHAFSFFSLAFGILVLLLLNHSWASGPSPATGVASSGSQHLFSATYKEPTTSLNMSLSILSKGIKGIRAELINGDTRTKEALCKVLKIDRFAKDGTTSRIDLGCYGARLRELRMPMHIVFQGGTTGGVLLQMGSVLTGVKEAKLRVRINDLHKIGAIPIVAVQ